MQSTCACHGASASVFGAHNHIRLSLLQERKESLNANVYHQHNHRAPRSSASEPTEYSRELLKREGTHLIDEEMQRSRGDSARAERKRKVPVREKLGAMSRELVDVVVALGVVVDPVASVGVTER